MKEKKQNQIILGLQDLKWLYLSWLCELGGFRSKVILNDDIWSLLLSVTCMNGFRFVFVIELKMNLVFFSM